MFQPETKLKIKEVKSRKEDKSLLKVHTMDPGEVSKAKGIADERTERTRGHYPNCKSPSCVKYMKQDGMCLKLSF